MFSSKNAAGLALAVVFLLAVLICMQAVELLSYGREPSVWMAVR